MAEFEINGYIRELPMFCDAATEGDGLMLDQNGDVVMLCGKQALTGWIERAIDPQSERFAYSAHTESYGNELSALFGGNAQQAQNRIVETVVATLTANPYITAVDNFAFEIDGSHLKVSFNVLTVYGDIEISSEVSYN